MRYLLWLRTAKLNKAGTAPVMLRVFLDQHTRSEHATGIRCRPADWNAASPDRKLRGTDKATADNNSFLNGLVAKARLAGERLTALRPDDAPPLLPAQVVAALQPEAVPRLLPALEGAVATYSPKVNTRLAANRALAWLRKWPPAPNLTLPGFTQQRASEWVIWLRGQELSASSLSTYIGLVAAVLAHAAPTHPSVLARQRKGLGGQQKPRRALAPGWQAKLSAEVLSPAERLACDVFLLQFYLHGSRIGAVLQLRWSAVADGRVRFLTQKRAVNQDVAISGALAAVLGRYQRAGAEFVLPLLPAGYGQLNPEAQQQALARATSRVNQALGRVGRKLGLGHLHSHLARHTLALRVYEANGYDLRLVQEALGHSNVSVTGLYMKGMTSTELDAGMANVYGS